MPTARQSLCSLHTIDTMNNNVEFAQNPQKPKKWNKIKKIPQFLKNTKLLTEKYLPLV